MFSRPTAEKSGIRSGGAIWYKAKSHAKPGTCTIAVTLLLVIGGEDTTQPETTQDGSFHAHHEWTERPILTDTADCDWLRRFSLGARKVSSEKKKSQQQEIGCRSLKTGIVTERKMERKENKATHMPVDDWYSLRWNALTLRLLWLSRFAKGFLPKEIKCLLCCDWLIWFLTELIYEHLARAQGVGCGVLVSWRSSKASFRNLDVLETVSRRNKRGWRVLAK